VLAYRNYAPGDSPSASLGLDENHPTSTHFEAALEMAQAAGLVAPIGKKVGVFRPSPSEADGESPGAYFP
jgi:hypothetical protein